MPLLVRPPHQAEVIVEQKVTLQPTELARHDSISRTSNSCHRDFRVVVANANRHTTEELERTLVTFQKRFGAFARKRLHEDRVRVRQCHHEERDLRQLAIKPHIGETEIHLGFAGWMRQRQKHFLVLLLPGSDSILDDRRAAIIPVFVSKPLEDPFRRVPLLAMHGSIGRENLINDRQKRFQLRRPFLR